MSSLWRWKSFVKTPSRVHNTFFFLMCITHLFISVESTALFTQIPISNPHATPKQVTRARSWDRADLWRLHQLLPRGLKSPEHCTVALRGACFSPLQLSSGVLMTPLMAAWAAAFCFFSSSIVFLNSFSSESLNKKKKPNGDTLENADGIEPLQRSHFSIWALVVDTEFMEYVCTRR